MTVIDEYIANSRATDEDKALLEHVRQLVHARVPELEEVISYNIAAFRHKPTGKVLLGFTVNKNSLGLYPFSGSALTKLKADISSFQTAKSALNFTVQHPLPDSVIEEIIAARLDEIGA